ncbi:Cytochrome P450 monooxygenase andK [Trichoderma lentiforme]|uniref:Cytochrome P450 monooxygenase andK n=1 Tax=Trichoderma lentiforme TaxID=1567552 RepID=A0A9P5C6W1_9HYPO|nr:Cytochrome P450 monooxygenase andK [Trichoderma lentiforme]
MLQDIVILSKEKFLYAIPFIILGWCLHIRYRHGFNKYKGPFLASFTDYWRYRYTRDHRNEIPSVALHAKYGDIVRAGPQKLSFANPEALKDIYSINRGYVKSEFYWVAASVSKGTPLPSLFSNLNESFHARLRRCVNNAFALSTLVQYEPLVDTTVHLFLRQLNKRFAGKQGTGGVIDFPTWLQYYAFDVIGELTYSSRHGFLESGQDVDGIIAYLDKYMSYLVLVGQMPILDKIFWKNPFFMWLSRHGLYDDTFPAVPFAVKAMRQRTDSDCKPSDTNGVPDLLSKFLNAKELHPDVVGDKEVLAMALSMIFAGSETTAISLSAVFYYLLKNPRCLSKLLEEIDKELPSDDSDEPFSSVKFADANKLIYLDACVKEAFRMHPAPAFDMERVVPPNGSTICGEFIPGGTIVSCNAWVIHKNKGIFGEDVDVYRPERWLEDDQRVKIMNSTLFHFGQGARTCIGKNISTLEIYKVVPSILKTFEVTLNDPKQDWKIKNATFVKPSHFDVRISLRQKKH